MGTSANACDNWEDGRPPAVSLRCRNKKRIADDGEELTEEHGADAMDEDSVEQAMRFAAEDEARNGEGHGESSEVGELADARVHVAAAAAASAKLGEIAGSSEVDYADHVEGDAQEDDEDLLEAMGDSKDIVEALVGV
eukprot:SAG31_NODE_3124_length_4649_cov_3.074066_4_plen_138_part_00